MPTMKQLLEANSGSGRRRITQVFQDFCELSALAIRNAVDRHGFNEREARYLAIAAGYTHEEMDRFATTLAHLAAALGDSLTDALGHLYMSLDLGNERLGQFFTPYDISLLTARMTVTDMVERLQHQEFITVSEPTCGSGGMVIATAQTLGEASINYQKAMHATAQDIDITAVHMTYVQLALLHIPALVVHGNTLTLEQDDVWPTPAHIIGRWASKLRPSDLRTTVMAGHVSGDQRKQLTVNHPTLISETAATEGVPNSLFDADLTKANVDGAPDRFDWLVVDEEAVVHAPVIGWQWNCPECGDSGLESEDLLVSPHGSQHATSMFSTIVPLNMEAVRNLP